METLVVVTQHRNQYYSSVNTNGPARFGASPSGQFRDINCRSFQSEGGILPTPFKNLTSPASKDTRSPSFDCYSNSPRTHATFKTFTSPDVKCSSDYHLSDNTCNQNGAPKSSPIPISARVPPKQLSNNDEEMNYLSGSFSFSERWAGPAYSNSPPPSSLPIPKFSVRPKRTVSFDLPFSESHDDEHPLAKSAPASPTRAANPSTKDMFLSADSATKTLCRILNLDIADD